MGCNLCSVLTHIFPSLQNVEHHRNKRPQALRFTLLVDSKSNVWTHVPRARRTVAGRIHDTKIYKVHPSIPRQFQIISLPTGSCYFFLEAMGTLGSLPFAHMGDSPSRVGRLCPTPFKCWKDAGWHSPGCLLSQPDIMPGYSLIYIYIYI